MNNRTRIAKQSRPHPCCRARIGLRYHSLRLQSKPACYPNQTGSIQESIFRSLCLKKPPPAWSLTWNSWRRNEAGSGASGYLASGSATFNVPQFEPKLEVTGSTYTLRKGNQKIEGIPVFKDDIRNEWDLQLADTPMSLNIQAALTTAALSWAGFRWRSWRFQMEEPTLQVRSLPQTMLKCHPSHTPPGHPTRT